MFIILVFAIGWFAVDFVALIPPLILAWFGVAPAGQTAGVLSYLVLTSAVLFVGAVFVVPSLLAMVGHGGKWFSHVSLRWGKRLAITLGLSVMLYLLGAAGSSLFSFASLDGMLTAFVLGLGALVLFVPLVVLKLAWGAGDAIAGVVSLIADRIRLVGADEVAIEIRQLPLDYVRNKEPDEQESRLLRFQRLAQTLAESGLEVQFCLLFADGFGRVLLVGKGRKKPVELEEILASATRTYLADFRPSAAEVPKGEPASKLAITGVPEPTSNPLEPLARYFVENKYDGEFVVSLRGIHPNPIFRLAAKRRQIAIARQAEAQTNVERLDATSDVESLVDRLGQLRLEEAAKRVERAAAKISTRVKVSVGAPNALVAAGAARVLVGTLSSNRREGGLSIAGRGSTLMLPSEAAPYLWVPEVSMGTEIAPSAEFEAPPRLEGEIELGNVVTMSGARGQLARIPLDQLTKHVFFAGMTGSGKTTSSFGLLVQLHRLGVPFLVIEPVKSEYRSLLESIGDFQVFTLGDEETAPFRLNIFEPPPGVKVRAHLENLEAVWNASFVSYAPLPYVIKQVFADTYRACGWDLVGNVRGRPITFDDVRVQVERVVRNLGYERDVTMDVEAALKTRLNSLMLGGKGPLFGAISSTPLEAVLRRPTVIELKDIQNDEEKAFVAALLLMNLAAWAQAKGQSKRLRHFTLIEEAHRLLPNVSTAKGDPESADPRRRAVEQFGNMLAELRAFGEGLAIVEQIPTKILPDAIKNTATKVIHRVPAEDDRKVLAGAINATEDQAAVFSALKPGEAVLSLENHPVPIRVEVENVVARLGVPVGEVADEEVRRHMTEFYLRNPLPRDAPRAAETRFRELVDSEAFRDSFLQSYHAWLRQGDVEPLRGLLVSAARKFAKGDDQVVEPAFRVLSLAVAFYLPLDDKDRVLFPRLFMRAVERSMGNVGRLR